MAKLMPKIPKREYSIEGLKEFLKGQPDRDVILRADEDLNRLEEAKLRATVVLKRNAEIRARRNMK